ncbi:hypothetical protein WT54_00500 [Burkholderia territorii]|nr:hypothetical protein WT54_00500 [Burkholderia territorii]
MRECANAGFKGAGRPVRRTASADRMSCAGRCASARDIRNMQHEPGFRVAHLNEIEHARRTFEWSSRSTPLTKRSAVTPTWPPSSSFRFV